MSRRKQSNPKPLKVDEEGGKEPSSTEQTTTSGNQSQELSADVDGEHDRDQRPSQEAESTSYEDEGGGGSPRSNRSSGGDGSCDLGKGIRIRSSRELTCAEDPNGEEDEAMDTNESDAREGLKSERSTKSQSHRRRQPTEGEMSPDEDSRGSASPAVGQTPFTAQQMLAAAGLPYLQHLNLNFAMQNDAAARLFFMQPELIPSTVPGAGPTPNGGVSGSSRSGGSNSRASKSITNFGTCERDGKNTNADLSPRAGPIYMCEPCNIKFSSANTLEAHQTFYCSFRKDLDKNGAKPEKVMLVPEFEPPKSQPLDRSTPSSLAAPMQSTGIKRSASSAGVGGPDSDGEDADDDEPTLSIDESQIPAPNRETEAESSNPNKSIKTGKQYACMYCSYSAEKKVSLNRHMRMHSGGGPSTSANTNAAMSAFSEDSRSCSTPFNASGKSQEPGSSAGGMGGATGPRECYCTDCDIQFSKVKTYRVHKQYYCSTRHVLKGQAITALPTGGAPSPQSLLANPPPSGSPAINSGPRQSSSRNSPSASCSPPTGAGTTGAGSPPTPFLLLPTNPVIIVPYCFIQAATLLPGNMVPSQNALVVLPNGIVQGLPNTLVLPPPSSSTPGPSGHQSGSGSSTSPNSISQQLQFNLNLPQFMFDDPKEVIKRMSSGGSDRSRKRNHVSSEELGKELNPGHRRDAMDLTLRPGSADDAMKGGSMSSLSSGSRSSSHAHLHQADANDQEQELISRSPDRMHSSGSGDLMQSKRSASVHSSRPSSASVSSTCSTSPPAPTLQRQHGNESKSNLPLNGLKLERLSPSSFSQLSESQQQLLLYQYQIQQQQQQQANAKILQAQSQSSSRSNHNQNSRSKSGASSHASIATTFPGGAVLTATNSGGGGPTTTPSLAELLMASGMGVGGNSGDIGDNLSKLNSQLLSGSNAAAMMAAAAASLPPEIAIRLLSDPSYLTSIQQSIVQQQNIMMSANSNNSTSAKSSPSPAAAPGMPTVPVKRGVSRCVECDIVFYKYENYLVHKEHYCAARGNNNAAGGASGVQVNGSSSEIKTEQDQLQISPPPQLPPPATRQRRSHVNQNARHQQQSPAISTRVRNSKMQMGMPSEEALAMMMNSPGDGSNCSGDGMGSHKSGMSGSPPSGVSLPGVTITSTATPQYACLNCGVKFSSLDTLKTHQEFYCPNARAKRPPPPIPDTIEGEDELEIVNMNHQQTKSNSKGPAVMVMNDKTGVVTCSKCKLVIPEDQLSVHGAMCAGNSGAPIHGHISTANSTGWKCPCCDTYSPTMSSAQKHLETHSGLRAFKCVLCGYRGNTIRGMRTHIRMHFDKRVSNDLHEADYITCITSHDLEPPAANAGTGHQNHAPVLSNASNAAATAAVHGALKIANSASNSPSQSHKSASPPLAATASKNVNNNNDTAGEDGVVMSAPGGGHHVTTTKAAMLYVS